MPPINDDVAAMLLHDRELRFRRNDLGAAGSGFA
jgi:hypothetical protein